MPHNPGVVSLLSGSAPPSAVQTAGLDMSESKVLKTADFTPMISVKFLRHRVIVKHSEIISSSSTFSLRI